MSGCQVCHFDRSWMSFDELLLFLSVLLFQASSVYCFHSADSHF